MDEVDEREWRYLLGWRKVRLRDVRLFLFQELRWVDKPLGRVRSHARVISSPTVPPVTHAPIALLLP